MTKEVRIQLKSPLKYGTSSGSFDEANAIIIVAPKTRQRKLYFKLVNKIKNSIMTNLKKMQSDSTNESADVAEKSEAQNHEEIKEMISAMVDDYENVAEDVRVLLLDRCGWIDDAVKTKLTGTLLDDLDLEDYEELITEYLACFLFKIKGLTH